MPVARLLFDSVSPNTGDIAIGVAGEQAFQKVGVATQIVDPFAASMMSPLVIGGGELMRVSGDPFYDTFRRTGPNILNAAGVWSNADDLSFLKDYEFVSARSEIEADVLRKWVPDAKVLPCTTTLLSSDDFEIPGIEPGEPVVGIHVVPHALRLIDELVPLIDAIPYKKVFIPFTHYNADSSFMKALPFDRSNSVILPKLRPLELHAVIRQMKYVVVSSLHASIFAYSQNVPFASVWQQKAENYFVDRGLGAHLVKSSVELEGLLNRLNSEQFDFGPLVANDRARIESAYRTYSEILGASTEVSESVKSPSVSSMQSLDSMLLDQAQHVIGDRDLALAHSEGRRLAAASHAAELALELARVRAERDDNRAQLDRIRETGIFKAAKATLNVYRSTRREIGQRIHRSH